MAESAPRRGLVTRRRAQGVLCACALAACTGGEPASPSAGAPPSAAPKDLGAEVGPAPLRRLSNAEYLNALRDLFPDVKPALPPLPADIPVAGFENAIEAQQASDVRVARYEEIANLYAEAATVDTGAVGALVGCADWASQAAADACAVRFIQTTGRRVFRRPLDGDERDRFAAHFRDWQGAVDFEGAARLTLSAMLQSPQFLYRTEPAPTDLPLGAVIPVEPYAMASRLSFLLWESVPDDALLDHAADGRLGTELDVRAEAERMLADDRARRALFSFHRQWLALDRILLDEHLVRTPEVDPMWSTYSPASAFRESELFVTNVLGEGGSFRDLLTSRRAWVNGEMARIYGVEAPADPAAWIPVLLPQAERAGLLTRAAFLAGFSHRGATSPPVRGNGIELRLLCQLPVSPPPGADLSQPTASPEQGPETNRMLFEARTRPPACQACHAALNGFGFGLETYDAAAHYHTTENGLPIDASGAIHGTDVDGRFNGGIELSQALSRSQVVHACAARQWMRYALGRAPVDSELATLSELTRAFMDSGGDVRALLLSIVTSRTFRMRRMEEN